MKQAIYLFIMSSIFCLSFQVTEKSETVESKNKIKVLPKVGWNVLGSVFSGPRPHAGMKNVPVGASYYFKLNVPEDPDDKVIMQSLSVTLKDENGHEISLIKNGVFSENFLGKLSYIKNNLAMYAESTKKLNSSTKYTIHFEASSEKGCVVDESEKWSFTTEAEGVFELPFELDLTKTPVIWHGQHFSGFLKPDFSNPYVYGKDRYDFLFSARKKYPRAWTLFRDFWMTGFNHHVKGLHNTLPPNIVRELETRRIVKIDEKENGMLLSLTDFFGHEQYGITSNRALSLDYHPGNEVQITDANICVITKVISVDDLARTVLVEKYTTKADFAIEYLEPLPEKAPENLPGLFPNGGTYLKKFNPTGTPRYYWDRLNFSWDVMVKEYGVRLVVGFNDAPGDLSVDGNSGTYAKDYAELHQVTYDITCHLIDRYGDRTLSWYWSIFNEPELKYMWRSADWIELQRFYDYSVDAILRAFEDRGYDSYQVKVGGIEMGCIFNINIGPIYPAFYIHCSPHVTGENALVFNQAYIDKRLDGKRSKRVEDLCRKYGGKGVPFDFASFHAYDASSVAAAKMINAKKIALEVDADYYRNLWITSFETVPTWTGIEDPGAAEMYQGNGYFASWMADFSQKLLAKAAEDERYSFGETILTFWHWPLTGLRSLNDVCRNISIDKDGDGRADRNEYIACPEFHFNNLLSEMENNFYVLDDQTVNGCLITGFAAVGDDCTRIILYSHNEFDAQSASDSEYKISLKVKGIKGTKKKEVNAEFYSFDKQNNTYYSYIRNNKDKTIFTEKEFKELKEMSQLKMTKKAKYKPDVEGIFTVKTDLLSNGVCFVVLK